MARGRGRGRRGRGEGSSSTSAPYPQPRGMNLRRGRSIPPVVTSHSAVSSSSQAPVSSAASLPTSTSLVSTLLPSHCHVADLSVDDFLRVVRAVVQESRDPETSVSSAQSPSQTSVTWSSQPPMVSPGAHPTQQGEGFIC